MAGYATPTSFAGHPSASYKPNRQLTKNGITYWGWPLIVNRID